MSETTRRAVLAGAAGLGAAAALSACGGGSSGYGTSGGTTSNASTTPGAGASTAGAGAKGLAATGDIPVGGGKVFDNQKVVVTQPTAGDFKAFTAVCTHQGCTVNAVADGKIKCPCHGSQYSITDGSVVMGPAPRPLASKPVKVENGEIVLG